MTATILRTTISIHALRGEGDSTRRLLPKVLLLFQSTPSVGRATFLAAFSKNVSAISIHALRGEGDDIVTDCYIKAKPFQSTPSVGRATCVGVISKDVISISIHALRGEGDGAVDVVFTLVDDFNPRPPWGGRLSPVPARPPRPAFQSTPSVGRATRESVKSRCQIYDFNPRPPWGGRQRLRCDRIQG